MTYSVMAGDVMDVLPTLDADSFDAMLTDPPYGLEFMGRDWDRVVPSVDVWRESLRVLKPGAFALVFGGTRTFHRLAVALEDAGFEMRDTLMWVYGSGFPKSHNLKGEWEGYGTALKPAWEPALLVRKPSPLTFAEGALVHGCGALNIDRCRVETDEHIPSFGVGKKSVGGIMNVTEELRDPYVQHDGGRWPANVIHDGSPEVVERFPRSDARPNTYGATPERSAAEGYGTRAWNKSGPVYADTGSAARFFYTAKADTSERDAGLEALPSKDAEARYGSVQDARPHTKNGYEYPRQPRRNTHPTVKPLALTEYLARLLLPPERDTKRRILTPFAGSGSEMIGALKAGWDETVGIEREPEYVEIARARLAHLSRGLQPRLLEAI